MKMRAKREGEGAAMAIASSPAQVLHAHAHAHTHATEKHIIVDHERSQLHLVSSTPSTQVPVLNSYHILNASGLLGGVGVGSDPRSLFSAHLLASIQQLAAATATATATATVASNEGRYQIPLTIQMPQQLYAQPPASAIQIPQQVLMSHHDLNVLNNLTESNLNLLQANAQQAQAQQKAVQQQSQYESIISRLMRGFMEPDGSAVDVHLLPLGVTSTVSGSTVVTTTTNSVAVNRNNKELQQATTPRPRKYVRSSRAKNNNNEKGGERATSKRGASAMSHADSTTPTPNSASAMVAAKNRRNKTTAAASGSGPIIIPSSPSYNHQVLDFLSSPLIAAVDAENGATTLLALPEGSNAKKQRKNATSTPKKPVTGKDAAVDRAKALNSPPTPAQHLHNNNGRDKVFSCPICKRTFGYKHVLQNHERTHTGEKPFECNICSKKFTRDHHLKTHMRLHTGEKPYQCNHCDRQFVQVANLRRHLRVHTGERPYACDICASKFSDSNQLKAHNLIHKGEKPYNCAECGGKFRRRHHLIHHKCNNNNGSSGTTPVQVKMQLQHEAGTYIVPALSPPLSSSPVAPAIHSGGSSSSSSLSSNGGGSRLNGSTKRERKSRETRRIIRPEGLSQTGSSVSPILVVARKSLPSLELPEEQTQPQDLSFANSSNCAITAKFSKLQGAAQGPVLQRHFTGSHSSCSGTSLSSPSPPTSGSHQEDSIFAACNSEEEAVEFTSASSSNCSGDEEHHLSGMTPPTSCSSHGGDQHLDGKGPGDTEAEDKMDWRFARHEFHDARDKLKGDA